VHHLADPLKGHGITIVFVGDHSVGGDLPPASEDGEPDAWFRAPGRWPRYPASGGLADSNRPGL
jgi:hypothetical protein